VIDAAADLFARRGVTEVTLREIAAAADVQLGLIARYIGNRDDLVQAVFDDLTEALAQEVVDRPLEQISFERDSVMGRWTIMLTHFAVTEPDELPMSAAFNPMLALAQVIMDNYGLDESAARLRGAQIVASALGWRIFERYLIEGGRVDIEREELRAEVTAMHRRLGATPWPSPPDPEPRRR
jgi:AcrR family transcriptional regulator